MIVKNADNVNFKQNCEMQIAKTKQSVSMEQHKQFRGAWGQKLLQKV